MRRVKRQAQPAVCHQPQEPLAGRVGIYDRDADNRDGGARGRLIIETEINL
ncbi:hypothetical protein [Pectobacterium parmentieri]|uniref:hypothetical protein n=1 Tax=Pectobacterium parmentieri TaxID=1905730 RepID=UPI0040485F88